MLRRVSWCVGALVALLVLWQLVLRGREPADVLSLSPPSGFPVPNVQSVDEPRDLLRSPDDPRAVGDPRLRDAARAEDQPPASP
jgi:hypothetical protein